MLCLQWLWNLLFQRCISGDILTRSVFIFNSTSSPMILDLALVILRYYKKCFEPVNYFRNPLHCCLITICLYHAIYFHLHSVCDAVGSTFNCLQSWINLFGFLFVCVRLATFQWSQRFQSGHSEFDSSCSWLLALTSCSVWFSAFFFKFCWVGGSQMNFWERNYTLNQMKYKWTNNTGKCHVSTSFSLIWGFDWRYVNYIFMLDRLQWFDAAWPEYLNHRLLKYVTRWKQAWIWFFFLRFSWT